MRRSAWNRTGLSSFSDDHHEILAMIRMTRGDSECVQRARVSLPKHSLRRAGARGLRGVPFPCGYGAAEICRTQHLWLNFLIYDPTKLCRMAQFSTEHSGV